MSRTAVSLLRLLASVIFLVVLAPSAQAACPKGIPTAEYAKLVDRYRSGDHAGAVNALSSWQDARLECDWKALENAAKKAAKCTRCAEKAAFERFSVRAALLLHADREARENLRPPVSEQAPPSCRVGVHARAVERLAEVLQAVDARAPDFFRPFYLGLARHAHFSHCLGIAEYWARTGLLRVPRDGLLLLTLGIAAENDAFHLRAPTAKNQAMSGKQRELWEEAQRTFEQALLADPALHEARLRLGRVLMRLGQTEAARAGFEAVLAADAEDAVLFLARMFLGRIFEDAGRLAEAEKEYLAALELKPSSQPAAVALSHVRQQQGNTEGAREVLQRFLAFAHRRTEIDPFIHYLMAHTGSGERLLEELRQANGK